MSFQLSDLPTTHHWWHDLVVTLEPIYVTLKHSSLGMTQGEIMACLDRHP